jgi:hypothetical protein
MYRILLGTFLIYAVLTTNGRAQSATPPCVGSVNVDAMRPLSLDSLVRASQVIVVGTVAEVYPPANIDPQHLQIQTESLISVDQLILGSLSGKTIALAQMGGKIPPYNWTVAGDPVVQKDERYVLFLYSDNRPLPPSPTGRPRFTTVGVGVGQVKIVNGKIQFSCDSSGQLKSHDDMDLSIFLDRVGSIAKVVGK